MWVLEEERNRASKVVVARPVGSDNEEEPILEAEIVLYSSGSDEDTPRVERPLNEEDDADEGEEEGEQQEEEEEADVTSVEGAPPP